MAVSPEYPRSRGKYDTGVAIVGAGTALFGTSWLYTAKQAQASDQQWHVQATGTFTEPFASGLTAVGFLLLGMQLAAYMRDVYRR